MLIFALLNWQRDRSQFAFVLMLVGLFLNRCKVHLYEQWRKSNWSPLFSNKFRVRQTNTMFSLHIWQMRKTLKEKSTDAQTRRLFTGKTLLSLHQMFSLFVLIVEGVVCSHCWRCCLFSLLKVLFVFVDCINFYRFAPSDYRKMFLNGRKEILVGGDEDQCRSANPFDDKHFHRFNSITEEIAPFSSTAKIDPTKKMKSRPLPKHSGNLEWQWKSKKWCLIEKNLICLVTPTMFWIRALSRLSNQGKRTFRQRSFSLPRVAWRGNNRLLSWRKDTQIVLRKMLNWHFKQRIFNLHHHRRGDQLAEDFTNIEKKR